MVIKSACLTKDTGGSLAVSKIMNSFYFSRRQYIRRFKKAIGLIPKRFSRIIRFQKALHHTKRNDPPEKIIEQYGYYDQAHLIKEFNELGGGHHRNGYSNHLQLLP